MLMNRRLTRSRTDTILGGVAAGLAEYLNTDPALVRIAWAILVPLTGGAALLAYIVAWIVMPEGPAPADADEAVEGTTADGTTAEGTTADGVTAPPVEKTARRGDIEGRAGIVVGVGLVILGAWFLAREYLPQVNWNLIWPLFLVGIGVLILVTSARRRP
jgi:phage shock protein C